jgi:DNA-binding GntR family transcriptional regulator
MTRHTHTGLARELAEGIASGRFPVGSLLPTELELCEQHGASRYTVRMALGELQEQGLISRKKNVGTRVEATQPRSGFMQQLSSVEDLVQFGATHARIVRRVDEVVADLALAEALGCAGGTRWLRISNLRTDGEGKKKRTIGWNDVYVDPAYSEIGRLVRESPEMLISSLIEARYGRRIARIQQNVDAIAVPDVLAGELQVDAGSPALRIVRRCLDASNEVFEISVSVHPAGRFIFSMDLNRARD